jgi:branched-chain amino acid transport system ATP-binding protein
LSLLEVEQLSVAYGDMVALHQVSLTVGEGEAVTVLGANAAGKTTLLQAISGLVGVRQGRIRFAGEAIEHLPAHRRVALGLVHVPEGRLVFPFLSVEDNLALGAFSRRARQTSAASLERVYTLFPGLVAGSSPARSREASSRCSPLGAP